MNVFRPRVTGTEVIGKHAYMVAKRLGHFRERLMASLGTKSSRLFPVHRNIGGPRTV
jgi:hypothetical protein